MTKEAAIKGIQVDNTVHEPLRLTAAKQESHLTAAKQEPLRLTAAKQGRLSVCATPIGNLGDLTERVVKALREADVILAEDTRVTRHLLSALDIHVALERSDEQSIRAKTPHYLERIKAGEHLALVSDAGMPSISDPGQVLIAAVRKAELPVEVLPGPSAVLTALVSSGFVAASFYFGGFLPRKPAQMRTLLAEMAKLPAALIFFESPHRIVATLQVIAEMLPDRAVCLARELTKLHEEVLVASATEMAANVAERALVSPLKGEITLVIAAAESKRSLRVHRDKYAPD